MQTEPRTRSPEPSPAPQPLPCAPQPGALTAASDTPYLDAHGFDPAAYDWVPVKRKPRGDGWSEERQRGFIEALADGGSVEQAARAVGMTRAGAYALRRAKGGESFARAWEAAMAQAVAMLVDVAFERAVNGSEEVVFDQQGRRVGLRHRHGDRMLMFLLAAHYPDRYGQQARTRTRPPQPAAPDPVPLAPDARLALPTEAAAVAQAPRLDAPLPLADALDRLAPVAPAEPHRAMAPADLDSAVQCADLLEGRLPPWRDPHRPQAEAPPAESIFDGEDGRPYVPAAGPLGEAFEIELELAKRAAARSIPGKRARRRAKARRV